MRAKLEREGQALSRYHKLVWSVFQVETVAVACSVAVKCLIDSNFVCYSVLEIVVVNSIKSAELSASP